MCQGRQNFVLVELYRITKDSQRACFGEVEDELAKVREPNSSIMTRIVEDYKYTLART